MKIFLICSIPIIIISLCGCKNNPVEPIFSNISLPELSDSIPYDKLGSGKILFQRTGQSYQGGIYILDIDNQKTWSLNSGSFPQISPGGDKVAFAGFTDMSSWSDIYFSDIYGNNKNRISYLNGTEQSPAWLPDNNRIIYWFHTFTAGQYYTPVLIYDIRSDTTNKILDMGPKGYYPKDIITVSKNDVCLLSTGEGLVTFGINGNNYKVIVSAPEGYQYYFPSWSPPGDRIAVMSIKLDSTTYTAEGEMYHQEMSIILFNPDGSDSTRIFTIHETQEAVANSWNDNSLCWSPDGTKILFNIREGYMISHIYVMNSDGSAFTKVTSLIGVLDRSLSWGK